MEAIPLTVFLYPPCSVGMSNLRISTFNLVCPFLFQYTLNPIVCSMTTWVFSAIYTTWTYCSLSTKCIQKLPALEVLVSSYFSVYKNNIPNDKTGWIFRSSLLSPLNKSVLHLSNIGRRVYTIISSLVHVTSTFHNFTKIALLFFSLSSHKL